MQVPRMVPVLACVALLAGCGGGDEDDPQPTASATPTATATAAEPEATTTPAVDTEAERKAAIQREITALRAPTPRRFTSLFYKYDTLALELGSKGFRVDTKAINRTSRQTTAPDGGFVKDFDAVMQRIERWEWATLAPVYKRYIRKLRKIKARGVAASARDFQAQEWERNLAFMQEFLGHLRRNPPRQTWGGFYQRRARNIETRWPVVIGTVARKEKPLVRSLRKALRKPGRTVGDVYRRAILAGFQNPLRKIKRREPNVAAKQWLLFRLRELEDTPDDVYETARLTLALQGIDEERSPYADLLGIGFEQVNLYFGDGPERRAARAQRKWALDMLSRPVPPLLERMRDQMVQVFEDLELRNPRGSDAYERSSDGLVLSRRYNADGKHLTRILRRGAKLADDPKVLRKATTEAIVATRPTGT